MLEILHYVTMFGAKFKREIQQVKKGSAWFPNSQRRRWTEKERDIFAASMLCAMHQMKFTILLKAEMSVHAHLISPAVCGTAANLPADLPAGKKSSHCKMLGNVQPSHEIQCNTNQVGQLLPWNLYAARRWEKMRSRFVEQTLGSHGTFDCFRTFFSVDFLSLRTQEQILTRDSICLSEDSQLLLMSLMRNPIALPQRS